MEQIKTDTEIDKVEYVDLREEFKPTDFQLEVSMSNWAYVIDPDNKLSRKELCNFVDAIQDPRVIVMLWMINTCVDGLAPIEDQKEKEHILRETSAFMGQCQDYSILNVLADRIITVLCLPIKITDNAGFLQIWSDIIEIVTVATEKLKGIEVDAFEPIEFPFCIQV